MSNLKAVPKHRRNLLRLAFAVAALIAVGDGASADPVSPAGWTTGIA